MNERRKFLAGLSLAAGLAPAMASAMPEHGEGHHGALDNRKLFGRSQMPEATVETHDGRKVRLYADLVQGKVVILNFMTIANEERFPISAKIAEVAKLLGDHLDTEVRIISITGDPEKDTEERLREFAAKIGAPVGWIFVRATLEDNSALASRFYRHGRDTTRLGTIDVVHYGNDAVGLWAAFPAGVTAEDAASRVRSVMSGKATSGELVQAGPRRLGDAGPSFNNRAI
ncbi:MAG TPA: SCO family protein [Methylocystis sp.]|jgi:protein SCO1/2